jgi:hypothetical protein
MGGFTGLRSGLGSRPLLSACRTMPLSFTAGVFRVLGKGLFRLGGMEPYPCQS